MASPEMKFLRSVKGCDRIKKLEPYDMSETFIWLQRAGLYNKNKNGKDMRTKYKMKGF